MEEREREGEREQLTHVRRSRSIAHPAGAGPVTISFIHFGSASSEGLGSCEWCVPVKRDSGRERVKEN